MDKPTKLTNKPNQTGQTTPISNKPTETKPNQTAWAFKAQGGAEEPFVQTCHRGTTERHRQISRSLDCLDQRQDDQDDQGAVKWNLLETSKHCTKLEFKLVVRPFCRGIDLEQGDGAEG